MDNAKKNKKLIKEKGLLYLGVFGRKLLLAILLSIITSFLSLPTHYLMKYIVDDVIVRKNIALLNLIVLAIFAIQILRLIFSQESLSLRTWILPQEDVYSPQNSAQNQRAKSRIS